MGDGEMAMSASDQRFARRAAAAAAATSGKASASTGAGMKAELAGTSALLSAAALWASSAIDGPSYGTRIMLMVAGCMLGTFASAFVSEEPDWKQRAQNAIGSLFVGFGVTILTVALYPEFKAADSRDWLLAVGFVGSFTSRWVLAWARSRNAVNATLDHWSEKFGVKTNRRKKTREKDEHEDGGP